MSKTTVMFQGRHSFVDSYYSGGEWHAVKPWQDLETPIIAHASTRQDKPNAVFLTRDVKAGPVYDETTCLMGHDHSEQVSFDELESFAAFLGWPQSFGRRVLVFIGGTNPLRPALMTGAGLQPFSCGQDADFWEKRLIEKGLEGVWTTGRNAVVFEWGEVDDIPQGTVIQGRTLTIRGGSPMDDYQTTCPSCEGTDCLYVVEANGKQMHSQLHGDGFEVPDHVAHGDDHSTEDERVKCEECGKTFDLFDLMM